MYFPVTFVRSRPHTLHIHTPARAVFDPAAGPPRAWLRLGASTTTSFIDLRAIFAFAGGGAGLVVHTGTHQVFSSWHSVSVAELRPKAHRADPRPRSMFYAMLVSKDASERRVGLSVGVGRGERAALYDHLVLRGVTRFLSQECA